MSSPLHVTPPSTSTGLARNLNAFVRYSSTAARAVNRALIQYTLRRHYSMIPTDRFFPSHRLRISGYAGIEYPLHILQSLSPLSRLTQLASPSLSPARRFRAVRVPWTLLCTITAVKTTVGWFTISGPSSWQSAPLSPPSTSRIRALLPHPLRLREFSTNYYIDTSDMNVSRLPPARRSSSTTPSTRRASQPNVPVRLVPALHSALLPRARIYYPERLGVGICSSAFGAPDTARLLHTRNEAGRVGYSRKVVAAEMNDARRLPLLTAYLGNGPQCVALMEWEEGVQWRGRWASLIVGPMLAHSFSHDLTVRRQAILDPIFARFRYVPCAGRFATIQVSVPSFKFYAIHPTYPIEYFGGFKLLERIRLEIYVLFHSRRIHSIFLAVKFAAETVNSSMGRSE
ncbi:hypothetical protein B0H13DRAFT_1889899 [Mycena leptocephala]|nr:hypothetical protein B0H13DRAFT_1889899 [Mycena leptocephala]